MENVGLMVALAGAMTKAPTAEQVSTAVDAWLDDHPEATTTVEDGSITNAKLATSFVTPGVASAYSSSATYAVGDYVFYNGALYRCTTPITTAEAWTAAHWTAAVLGDDVGDLKSALHNDSKYIVGENNLLDNVGFTSGYYINASGDVTASSGFSYSDLIDIGNESYTLYWSVISGNNNLRVHGYDSNGTWLKQIGYNTSGTPISFMDSSVKKVRISYNATGQKLIGLYESNTISERVDMLTGTTRNINITGQGRYRISSGSIIASNNNYFGICDFVECEAETNYTFGFFNISANSEIATYPLFYDASKTLISTATAYNISSSGGYVTVKSPENAKYIYVYAFHSSGVTISETSKIQIEEGVQKNPYIVPVCAYDAQARTDAVKCAENMFGINVPFSEINGYYSATGEIIAPSENKEKSTNLIDVELVKNIIFSLSYSQSRTMWASVAKFNSSGVFRSRINFVNSSKETFSYLFTPETGDRYISFSYRTYDDATVTITGDIVGSGVLNVLEGIGANEDTNKLYQLPTKPCYDHLFVNNRSESSITIPHESLYHVRVSRLFGFNMIEANVYPTADNVFIVNHLADGKFGQYFVHVDGTTDISNILVSSVTWEWITENVRYKSAIPQYRTRPCRLEEFLGECKQQGITPFISAGNSAVVKLANQYMGKGNFIAYNGVRSTCPTEVIYRWLSKTTKADILAECEFYGKPFIYGMANPTTFSDSELRDIVDTLHENGYWIGVSYADDKWHKYSDMGFDINGTQTRINRIDNGNICNLYTLFGFSDFTFTNATEANGVLTYTADGTLVPNVANDTLSICAIDIEISFSGTITLPVIGENKNSVTYTSDGSYPMFAAVPIINGSPNVTLNVSNGTIITDIKFKATKV